jgi:hypothetical protein
MRFDQSEKLDFIKKELVSVRDEIEKDELHNVYLVFSKKLGDILREQSYLKTHQSVFEQEFARESPNINSSDLFEFASLDYNKKPDKNFPDRLDNFIKSLLTVTSHSSRLQEVVNDGSPKDALARLAIYIYYEKEYLTYLSNLYKEVETGASALPANTSNLKWLGDNETEFVQFIYALKEAGFVGNDDRGIESLVMDFSRAFNYKLGDHWQSNHSSSIHKANSDYCPEIFDKLKLAYSNFRLEKIDKKKKI